MTLSIVITIILGFATCVSPPIVALINNHHARKMRQMEIDANNYQKQMEQEMQLRNQVLSSEYEAKYKAYSNFVTCVAEYLHDYKNPQTYSAIMSAYGDCMLSGFSFGASGHFMGLIKSPVEISESGDIQLDQIANLLKNDISAQFWMDLCKMRRQIINGQFDET